MKSKLTVCAIAIFFVNNAFSMVDYLDKNIQQNFMPFISKGISIGAKYGQKIPGYTAHGLGYACGNSAYGLGYTLKQFKNVTSYMDKQTLLHSGQILDIVEKNDIYGKKLIEKGKDWTKYGNTILEENCDSEKRKSSLMSVSLKNIIYGTKAAVGTMYMVSGATVQGMGFGAYSLSVVGKLFSPKISVKFNAFSNSLIKSGKVATGYGQSLWKEDTQSSEAYVDHVVYGTKAVFGGAFVSSGLAVQSLGFGMRCFGNTTLTGNVLANYLSPTLNMLEKNLDIASNASNAFANQYLIT